MVRRPEWRISDKSFLESAGNRMNSCGLESFFEGKLRQNSGKGLGKHGFAGTGRPVHCDIVPACSRDKKSPLRSLLAPNIREICRNNNRFIFKNSSFRRIKSVFSG